MKRILATAIAAVSLTSAAYADGHLGSGDPEAGAKGFKKCKSCHMIVSDADETIVKGGKTGPNLYGIVGRTAGTVEGFRYGADLVAAGEAGLVWDEESFVSYAQDPKKFLATYLDKAGARSKMSFRLKKGAEDVYSYLASVAPAPEEGDS